MSQVGTLAVPGLLQTADYAEAVVKATRPELNLPQARRLASMSLSRQTLARRSGRQLNLVIDEAALLRPVASPDVMADQMRHLVTASADPSMTVSVITLSALPLVLSPAFTLLAFDDPRDLGVACYSRIGGQLAVTQDAEQVSTLQATFAALSRAALSPAASIDLIKRLHTVHPAQHQHPQVRPDDNS